ncbi:DUF2306 domain-containing protein [Phenylobacterium sp.]|uniref:DUF2306 domain-containing protein n=1 Tax=Phenylobacterium sp. TaxID=1871053 RepID=UPI00286C23E1|nr:DUF2306 domain-containing protein [Phenylobacterium sp.]
MTDAARTPGGTMGLGLWVVLIFSVLIGLMSYRYLVPGGLGLAPDILANRFTKYGVLTLHAGFAATALILGPFQFIPALRRGRPRLHRRIGTAYVVCCLAAGAAGLVLSFGALTGPVSTAGFGLLAVAWLLTTGQAWRLAKARRFVEHERWMIRSFALTLAAVTLRAYLPFAFLSPFGYDDTYRAISFLAWVPNLIAAEVFLASRRPRSSPYPG